MLPIARSKSFLYFADVNGFVFSVQVVSKEVISEKFYKLPLFNNEDEVTEWYNKQD